MRQQLTISALAKGTGASPKTLRYWERLGLLPRAFRTHTGYRLFDHKALHYVQFIQKCKSVGLTLAEMKRLLEMTRKGQNPCPEVIRWADEKARTVAEQIQTLQRLQQRLREFRRGYERDSALNCFRPGELCCLIEDLPDFKPEKGGRNAKTLFAGAGATGSSRRQSGNARRDHRD